MKLNLALLAATCFTALAACTPQAGGNNQASPAGNSAGNASAPADGNASVGNSSATAPAAGGSVDEAFLIGRWGRDGDCSQTLEFRAGGAAFPPEGSRWSMAGNVVTVTTPGGQPEPRTVARVGNDRMTVTGEGPPLTLNRCR